MFLSIFMSLLLARRFRGKTYVFLMMAALFLVSMFSTGFPSIKSLEAEPREGYWQVNLFAIPLSFPFYVYISKISEFIRFSDIFPPLYLQVQTQTQINVTHEI